MKYFYIRGRVAYLGGNKGMDKIQIVTTEEQLKKIINEGEIKNFYKTNAFKVGDYVTLKDKLSEGGDLSKYEGKSFKVLNMNTESGSVEFVNNFSITFFFQDIKKV